MKVFLTGANGFSGSHILRHLLECGHQVYAIFRKHPFLLNAIEPQHRGNMILRQGDLNTLQELPQDIDAIIHTAATSPDSNIKTEDFIRDNVLATEKLVQLALESGIKKFIFFSSLSVYGHIQVPVVDELTSIINPNPYGASKLLGEFSLKEYASQISSIAIRLPAVIGLGAKRHWLANTIEKAMKGEEITIFNPNAAFNNAVHIQDLSQLVECLMSQDFEGAETITVASEGHLLIQDIIERILKVTNSSSEIRRESNAKHSFIISNKKAIQDYHFKPKNFEKGLSSYLEAVIMDRKEPVNY
jgi:UDP-glucose 4-epimerase